jgi:protein-disulfide isomerase
MKNTLIWLIAAVAILIGGMAVINMANKDKVPSSSELAVAVNENDHILGNGNIELVEYSDFQCPACAAYAPAVKQLLAEIGEEITFVYRHFPLRGIHLNAQLAAQASEAAALQGKFWEMHDIIFERQEEWSGVANPTALFASYAETLELDVDKFSTDLLSSETKAKVDNDYDSGIKSKVGATPTFFLNGQVMQNPRNYQELKERVLNVQNNSQLE